MMPGNRGDAAVPSPAELSGDRVLRDEVDTRLLYGGIFLKNPKTVKCCPCRRKPLTDQDSF